MLTQLCVSFFMKFKTFDFILSSSSKYLTQMIFLQFVSVCNFMIVFQMGLAINSLFVMNLSLVILNLFIIAFLNYLNFIGVYLLILSMINFFYCQVLFFMFSKMKYPLSRQLIYLKFLYHSYGFGVCEMMDVLSQLSESEFPMYGLEATSSDLNGFLMLDSTLSVLFKHSVFTIGFSFIFLLSLNSEGSKGALYETEDQLEKGAKNCPFSYYRSFQSHKMLMAS